MDEHSNLLLKAKQTQRESLKESEFLSAQLQKTLESLIRSNSKNDINGPSSLDKITTIHQIDNEINRQLNKDISVNFQELLNDKKRLVKRMNKCYKLLQQTKTSNIIDNLQKNSELIDQELRIIENTVRNINGGGDR